MNKKTIGRCSVFLSFALVFTAQAKTGGAVYIIPDNPDVIEIWTQPDIKDEPGTRIEEPQESDVSIGEPIVIASESPIEPKKAVAETAVNATEPEKAVKEENTNTGSHEYSSISMTAEERALLKKVVAAEAQTQGFEGRKAVVEVIFNRVLSKRYPNTVKGVLSQKGEFSTYKMRNASWVEPERATKAIDYVLANGRTVLPNTKYLYFATKKMSYATGYIKIQDHWFGRAK